MTFLLMNKRFFLFLLTLFILSASILALASENNPPIPQDNPPKSPFSKGGQKGDLAKGGEGAFEVSLIAVGDVMIGGHVKEFTDQFSFNYPFEATRDILQNADLTFCNLEGPIAKNGVKEEGKEFTFKTEPKAAEGLANAGFDVVSLANNHIMDYGADALFETIEHLEKNNIKDIGAGKDLSSSRKPALFEVNGVTIAFLAYAFTFPLHFYAEPDKPGSAPGVSEFIERDIKKAKKKNDIVIVSFHWGAELMTEPKEYQIKIGHSAIDWGAAIVLGHHPHVLQGIEIYNKGLIAYSLGNFAFGSYSKNVKDGMMLSIRFNKSGLKEAKIIPISVYNIDVLFQPKVLKGDDGRRVIEHIKKISQGFDTQITLVEDIGVVALWDYKNSM